MQTKSRHGFTLVELLIVIAIIGTLMGLLLPAVNAARERARQLTCNNNLGQLSKAMVSIATNGKGEFPGWMQLQRLAPGVNDAYSETPSIADIEVSWAAKLLPQIDRGGDWDTLLMGNLGQEFGNWPNQADNMPMIEVFLCPSDVRTNPEEAGLTYVVNAGAPDRGRQGGGDPSDYAANGICHDLRTGPSPALTPQGPRVRFGSDIKDGGSTTLLLSENVDKDGADSNVRTTWLRTSILFDDIGIPQRAEQVFGMVWVYNDENALNPADPNTDFNKRQERFNRNQTESVNFAINGRLFARPASEHPELFLVAFVGGNTRSIRDSIEYRVYQQLMTPNGAKCIWPEDSSAIMPNAFYNADPTLRLSDSDY